MLAVMNVKKTKVRVAGPIRQVSSEMIKIVLVVFEFMVKMVDKIAKALL